MVAGRSLQQQVVNPMEKRVKVLKLTPHDNVAHVIGRASIDIQSGELVHVHNIEGTRGRGDLNQ